jgi:hypothetical protein
MIWSAVGLEARYTSSKSRRTCAAGNLHAFSRLADYCQRIAQCSFGCRDPTVICHCDLSGNQVTQGEAQHIPNSTFSCSYSMKFIEAWSRAYIIYLTIFCTVTYGRTPESEVYKGVKPVWYHLNNCVEIDIRKLHPSRYVDVLRLRRKKADSVDREADRKPGCRIYLVIAQAR